MKTFTEIPAPPSPYKTFGTSDWCRRIHAWEKENNIKHEEWMKMRDEYNKGTPEQEE